ncbi:outer membrane beta-barrel protein [uncultured Bacteroides sp.]|uniref:outer membrane beta-barrel protein n=1 Tax=uncultured Bacteroides sp. TaxID=162156 RepID=UPI002602E4E1|nr:outer membrane beta-barrel protein [uncultured Bacteroides sp.]
MKTISIIKKLAIAVCGVFAFVLPSHAQLNPDNIHLTIDWQANTPSSSGFADALGGWGMNFEATYEITPSFSTGAFVNFHTNHDYVERGTFPLSSTEMLTTDQLRSAYQVPFGLTSSYNLYNGAYITPYVGSKIGAVFARNTTYFGANGVYDDSWGFYMSPEIGVKISPSSNFNHFAFHIAAYYSYMTNHTSTLSGDVDGQSNIGFRVGVIF